MEYVQQNWFFTLCQKTGESFSDKIIMQSCVTFMNIWRLSDYKHNIAVTDEAGETLTFGVLAGEADLLSEKIDGRCLVFCLCQKPGRYCK